MEFWKINKNEQKLGGGKEEIYCSNCAQPISQFGSSVKPNPSLWPFWSNGAKYLATIRGPAAFILNKVCISSKLTSDNRVSPFPDGCKSPALLIRSSSFPYFCLTCSAAWIIWFSLVTSTWRTSTLGILKLKHYIKSYIFITFFIKWKISFRPPWLFQLSNTKKVRMSSDSRSPMRKPHLLVPKSERIPSNTMEPLVTRWNP